MTETISETTPTHQEKQQLPKYLLLFFLGGLAISFTLDFLFWQKPFGYSYAIWVGIILLVSVLLAWREKKHIPTTSYTLIAALVLTTAAAVWRMETGTRVYNVLASLFLIGLICDTLLTGGALRFRVADVIARLVLLVFAAFERPIQAFTALNENKNKTESKQLWKKSIAPVLRGILIAIPILLIFSALFASADPVFEQAFDNFFAWLKIDNWFESLWRGFYILVLGFLFSGALLHAFSGKRYHTPNQSDKPLIKPFLGKIEAFTILGLLELLFAVFLFIQFRYLFGGQTNINFTGSTYAEYARKGTNELIVVALLSLLVYQALHLITKASEKKERLVLHILMTILFAEVLVILVSSFQRLDMYQTVYGFTRIRVRTHLFIIWLAALLSLVILLEWLGKSRLFFAVLLTISLGFILSQAVLNIDQHIVQRNLARLSEELPDVAWERFDHNYLRSLSYDAAPQMVEAVDEGSYDDLTTEMLRAELYCMQQELVEYYESNTNPWFSDSPSRWNAYQLLKDEENLLSPYSTIKDNEITLSNQEIHYCYGWRFD